MSKTTMVTPSRNIEDRFYVNGTNNRFYFDVVSFKRGYARIKYPEDASFDDLVVNITGILQEESNFKDEMFRAFNFPIFKEETKKPYMIMQPREIGLKFLGVRFLYKGVPIDIPFGSDDICVVDTINRTAQKWYLKRNSYREYAKRIEQSIPMMALDIPDEFDLFKWNKALAEGDKNGAAMFASYFGRIAQHNLTTDKNISFNRAFEKALFAMSAMSDKLTFKIIREGIDLLCDVNWVYFRELRKWYDENLV